MRGQHLLGRPRVHGATVAYPWFRREDVDGFFALFQNNLANFALIAILMAGIGFPAEIIFTRMNPGTAVAVLFGNLYYARMARRLAEREGRSDVTSAARAVVAKDNRAGVQPVQAGAQVHPPGENRTQQLEPRFRETRAFQLSSC